MTHVFSALFRREFRSYFQTPLAGVFLVIFLLLSGLFTFQLGGLFERGQADLRPFFQFLPWLYLFLAPAVAMRLWAEDRRTGTIEILMTLPCPSWLVVLAKFLASWAFLSLAILLTCPLWMTVSYLGDPDHGIILTSYFGAILMGGAYLALGAAVSAATKNQVIAFILAVLISFGFLSAGYPVVLDFLGGWAPDFFVQAVASTSFLTHFDALQRGVLDMRDVLFFLLVMATSLVINRIMIDWKKAA